MTIELRERYAGRVWVNEEDDTVTRRLQPGDTIVLNHGRDQTITVRDSDSLAVSQETNDPDNPQITILTRELINQAKLGEGCSQFPPKPGQKISAQIIFRPDPSLEAEGNY